MKMTKGMKSSEFWLTLIFSAVAIICRIVLGEKCPLPDVTFPSIISAYAISRGLAKRGD